MSNFLERSRLERNVINLVNERFQNYAELSGLSNLAIVRWSEEVDQSSSINFDRLQEIVSILFEVSQRISSDSDSSKHIFINNLFDKNSTIDICLDQLKEKLVF